MAVTVRHWLHSLVLKNKIWMRLRVRLEDEVCMKMKRASLFLSGNPRLRRWRQLDSFRFNFHISDGETSGSTMTSYMEKIWKERWFRSLNNSKSEQIDKSFTKILYSLQHDEARDEVLIYCKLTQFQDWRKCVKILDKIWKKWQKWGWKIQHKLLDKCGARRRWKKKGGCL